MLRCSHRVFQIDETSVNRQSRKRQINPIQNSISTEQASAQVFSIAINDVGPDIQALAVLDRLIHRHITMTDARTAKS